MLTRRSADTPELDTFREAYRVDVTTRDVCSHVDDYSLQVSNYHNSDVR